ncbi:hypothetical protein SAMN05518848_101745 [Paenibacillus sp. PDC88]|nr:hypothetical protein SAMN05518848_101745 [Paenibacillus sp. PDC88]
MFKFFAIWYAVNAVLLAVGVLEPTPLSSTLLCVLLAIIFYTESLERKGGR